MRHISTLFSGTVVTIGLAFTHAVPAATPPALSNPTPDAPSMAPAYLGILPGGGTVSAGGNASYVIPLELPPGIGGLTPQLSLNYNSNMRNGLQGLGWFLQGANSAITRCAQNRAQDGQIRAIDYSATDRFCLDGHRLMVVNGGTYGAAGTVYRTETDNFSRVESLGSAGSGPAKFEVRTKDGRIKTYGSSSDSRIEAYESDSVRTWALQKVQDRAGNYYTLSYYENNFLGLYYPTQINYTANDSAGVSATSRVEFNYEDRSDDRFSFVGGAKIRHERKRLSSLQTFASTTLVTDYRLSYEEVGVDNRSRLTEIKRCDGSGACQAPTTMEWLSDGETDFVEEALQVPYYDAGGSSNSVYSQAATLGKNYNTPRWHDMNGDGLPDYVHPRPSTNGNYSTTASSMSIAMRISQPGGDYSWETWTAGFSEHPKYFHWSDMNGDGLTDIVLEKSKGDGGRYIAFSNGSGFDTELWPVEQDSTAPENIYYRDMDGDWLLDRVRLEGDGLFGCTFPNCWLTTNLSVYVELNTGSGFGSEQVWLDDEVVDTSTLNFIDMNGDKLPDIVTDTTSYLNDGTSFGAGTLDNGPDIPYLFSDYNGDGLPDMFVLRSNGLCCEVHYNTGRSFLWMDTGEVSSIPIPTVDANGNGLKDEYKREVTRGPMLLHLYEPPPGVGATTLSLNFAEDARLNFEEVEWHYPEGMDFFQQWTDLNGDGMPDHTLARTRLCFQDEVTIVAEPIYNMMQYTFCEKNFLQILKNSGKPAHLMAAVTNGLGYRTEFSYKPLTDNNVYTKGSAAVLPQQDVQDNTYVVSSLVTPDGIGGELEATYTYEGMKRDTRGRGSLGFARITSHSPDRDTTTMTDYGQAFPYVSQPSRVEVRRSSDNRLLNSTDTTYSVHGTIGDGPVFPYVDTRSNALFDLGDGRLLSKITITNHCDAYGNITDTMQAVTDHENNQTFQTQTLSTYTIDDSNQWRVAQLDSKTVKQWRNGSYNSGLDRTTAHDYDPETGLRQSSTREPGGGVGIELKTTLGRDVFGNVVSEALSGPGLSARSSTITYDSQGQFPQTMTNALGHQTTLTWDARFGQKTSQTDANNLTTHWAYDELGRQTLETRPDGTTTASGYHRFIAGNEGSGFPHSPESAFYVETRSTGAAPVTAFFDLMGRIVNTRTQGFSGDHRWQTTEYDHLGRAYRASEPHDGSTVAWNTTTYDDLNRVTSLTAADPSQSSTTGYDGFSVALTDALSRTSTQWLNALGQVMQVDDAAGTRMSSVYDPAGNRLEVKNAVGSALQNAVTYSYDRLGRLLTQKDPDHGIYTYTYDALGQKLTEASPKLTAKGKIIAYQYDVLGRMTSRADPEGGTTWTYDNTAGGNLGLGRMHSEDLSQFTRTYSYAATGHGRTTGSVTNIGSSIYNKSVIYNAQGQLAIETYPSGSAVSYSYNALGFLERVSGGGDVHYQLVSTDTSGRVTSEWLGDGSLTAQGYDGYSARLSSQHTLNGTVDIQHFSYSYDSSGNMTNRSDVARSLSETFSYDNLDRLSSAQVAGLSAAVYNFDEVGNITEKSDRGNPYQYTSSKVHAVKKITIGATTEVLAYDKNGNLRRGDNAPTIHWSSYNKPTMLKKGGTQYNFYYGPDRKRYKKVHSSVTTNYVGDNYEEIKSGTSTRYRHVIRANGRAVALRKEYSSTSNVDTQYLHRDHLGSVTALTQSDGTVIERYSYDAWGQRRSAVDWVAGLTATTYELRGYTGHEHLDDIGVIHMNGRVYEPSLGRMLSPDPVTQAPENGQNYNRYTYALNNPLRFTDPSGFMAIQELTDAELSGGRNNTRYRSGGRRFPSGGGFGYFESVFIGGREAVGLFHRGTYLNRFGDLFATNTLQSFRFLPEVVKGDNGTAVEINPVVGANGDPLAGFENTCHGDTCIIYSKELEGQGPIINQKTKWEGVGNWDVEVPIGGLIGAGVGLGELLRAKFPSAGINFPNIVFRSGTEFGHQEILQEQFEQAYVSVVVAGKVTSRQPIPGRNRSTGSAVWTPASGGSIFQRTNNQWCIEKDCLSFP